VLFSLGDPGETPVDAERHLQETDLIVVPLVPQTRKMNTLRSYALNNNWRLIRRLEKNPIVAELYERPSPP
jgi:hypothetical protein